MYAPLVLYLMSQLSLILWPMFPNWSLILVPNGVCSYSSLDLILRSYGCTSIIFLFYPIVYSLLRVSELIPHWRIEPFIIDSTYNIVFDHIDYWFLILRSELYSACQMSIVSDSIYLLVLNLTSCWSLILPPIGPLVLDFTYMLFDHNGLLVHDHVIKHYTTSIHWSLIIIVHGLSPIIKHWSLTHAAFSIDIWF